MLMKVGTNYHVVSLKLQIRNLNVQNFDKMLCKALRDVPVTNIHPLQYFPSILYITPIRNITSHLKQIFLHLHAASRPGDTSAFVLT